MAITSLTSSPIWANIPSGKLSFTRESSKRPALLSANSRISTTSKDRNIRPSWKSSNNLLPDSNQHTDRKSTKKPVNVCKNQHILWSKQTAETACSMSRSCSTLLLLITNSMLQIEVCKPCSKRNLSSTNYQKGTTPTSKSSTAILAINTKHSKINIRPLSFLWNYWPFTTRQALNQWR